VIDKATDWRAAAACLSADPDLFFPIATGGTAEGEASSALRICARCTVRKQCLDFAMRTGETQGIWGGTTPDQRTRVRRNSARVRQRARAQQRALGARAS
jgi:WhiB family redox-sensing transcriptional regulator